MYQKFLFRESKNLIIPVNYPGIQIFRYIWTGKWGVYFSRDRPKIHAYTIFQISLIHTYNVKESSTEVKTHTGNLADKLQINQLSTRVKARKIFTEALQDQTIIIAYALA